MLNPASPEVKKKKRVFYFIDCKYSEVPQPQ